jgi:hypothetical protein
MPTFPAWAAGHNLFGLAAGKLQTPIGHQFNKIYLPRMSPSQFARITSRQINADR